MKNLSTIVFSEVIPSNNHTADTNRSIHSEYKTLLDNLTSCRPLEGMQSILSAKFKHIVEKAIIRRIRNQKFSYLIM